MWLVHKLETGYKDRLQGEERERLELNLLARTLMEPAGPKQD